MWNLCKCNGWLIIEIILQTARCNNKVYCQSSVRLFVSLHVLQRMHGTKVKITSAYIPPSIKWPIQNIWQNYSSVYLNLYMCG